ncbi:glycoside hydrolase superfamily [Peziza echinospora]|nr:glycoside hydrolase superfamily [Peziza echinospora]
MPQLTEGLWTILLLLLLHSTTISSAIVQPRQASGSTYSPPYYPTPKGGWLPSWAEAYTKASALVKQMTLAEKVNVTTSTGWSMGKCVGNTGQVHRLGYPSICSQDGPVGVRYADLVTAFPAGLTTGATWNKALMKARGTAMGEESKAKGVHVLLAPSIGPLGRVPTGGRNWEGFGSDPVLQAYGGKLTIEGIQGAGVQATVKHYIANEQEHFRGDGFMTTTISSNVDDRTMHEIYLWPFSEAVRAGVASVMCSYNMINSSYGCQNSQLINGVLKNELGFQGYVMSDWLGQRSGVASALAGLDQSQPGDGTSWANGISLWGSELSRSVLNGSVPVDRLNDMVTRTVAAWYKLGQDKGYPEVSFSSWTKADNDVLYKGANTGPTVRVNSHINVQGNHKDVARAVAREGIVLLKHEGNVLPLAKADVIRVFGSDAGGNPQGPNACGDRGCNTGVLGMGWGSGTVDYPYLTTPIDAITARGSNVQSSLSDTVNSQTTQLAGTANAKCLVFISSDGGEGYITVEGHAGDRNNLLAWHNGDALVKAVAGACKNTIVVIHAVGPVIVEAFADLANVKAILAAHLPGQEAGSALADILFGDFSPSGKLPYTYGKKDSDWGTSITTSGGGSALAQPFTEGLYVDYKYFDKNNITPRYPFGHGLSYTNFSMSLAKIENLKPFTEIPPAPPAKVSSGIPVYPTNIPSASEVSWPSNIQQKITKFIYPYLDNPNSISVGNYPYPAGYSTTEKPLHPSGGGEGGNPALWDVMYSVSVTVTNTGGFTGKQVVQVYIEFPKGSAFETPIRQLRAFEKTAELKPGDKEVVSFQLTRKDFSVWDTNRQLWIIPTGSFTVHLAESSRALKLSCQTSTLVCV